MNLINNQVADSWSCDFVMNEYIVLVRSGHFKTKQKNLVHSCFSLGPNVTASKSGCRKCLRIDGLCWDTFGM